MTAEVVLWQILLRSKARLFQKKKQVWGSVSGKYLGSERVNVRVNSRNKTNKELQKKNLYCVLGEASSTCHHIK